MRRYTLKTDRPAGRSGFLSELNDEQRRVAEATTGAVLVVAGAGTGKTRTLTYRTAHLVAQGVPPDRLLLLTFTNKAAREMIDRVSRLVPEAAARIWAGTFHAIAHRILRQHAERLGYGNNYGILGPEEARDLMDVVLATTVPDVSRRRMPKAQVLLAMLSSSVNTERPLAQIVRDEHPQFAPDLAVIDEALTTYLAQKVEMNVMDYDDLLVNWSLLLEDHPEVQQAYAARFAHVLVDEYQDTNRLQAAIVARMVGRGLPAMSAQRAPGLEDAPDGAGDDDSPAPSWGAGDGPGNGPGNDTGYGDGDGALARGGSLMVVGDDSQSIYGFRGAEVRNILDFGRQYPGAQIFRLETNYRSSPQIVALANASIRHNRQRIDKTLKAVNADGELPAFVACADGEQQAQFVAQRVLELRDEGVDLKQQVVLYRAHYQAMELQLELQRRGIPFSIRSGQKFFEQAHIRDLLAHLRVLFNPLDRLAWVRVLKLQPGIGNSHAVGIFEALAATGDPWGALVAGAVLPNLPKRPREGFALARTTLLALGAPGMAGNPGTMLDHLLGAGGYGAHLERTYPDHTQRGEDVRQLAHYASQFGDYAQFLEDLALVESVGAEAVQSGEPTDERLVLSTVHQSKGLEWDAVFVIGLADGQFPLRRALRTDDEEEEERRLFYVAVTRARRFLHLCAPQWGNDREHRRVLQRPSRFLQELPHTRTDLVETWRLSED